MLNIDNSTDWQKGLRLSSLDHTLTKEQKEHFALAMLKWINKELEKK